MKSGFETFLYIHITCGVLKLPAPAPLYPIPFIAVHSGTQVPTGDSVGSQLESR